jgi:hypothetical protein
MWQYCWFHDAVDQMGLCNGYDRGSGTGAPEAGREGLSLIDKLTPKTSLCSLQKMYIPIVQRVVNEGTRMSLYSWIHLYYIISVFLTLRPFLKVYFFSMLSL